jgi:uncharacterized surface protein with fasciclin (FAS1) repeats
MTQANKTAFVVEMTTLKPSVKREDRPMSYSSTTDSNKTVSSKSANYGPVIALGLVMALGPLTALSLGTRLAGEETWERAQAGLKNAKPTDMFSNYGQATGVPAYASGKTLSDVLAGSGVFDSFREAAVAAGVDATLASEGAFTVFVPSDEAFAKLSDDERQSLMNDPQALNRLLAKHIVPGRYTATDLMKPLEARALNGESLSIGPSSSAGGHIAVGGASVVKTNLFAANGVAHVIDRVIQ